jgi:hypothetical protein
MAQMSTTESSELAPAETASGEESGTRHRKAPKQFWAQQAFSKILSLRDRLALLDLTPEPSKHQRQVADEVRQRLASAEEAVSQEYRLLSWSRLSDWWYGSRVETAWSQLHEAELLLASAATKGSLYDLMLEDAISHAENLPTNDPDRTRMFAIADNARPAGQ